jgi:hypothetical protein
MTMLFTSDSRYNCVVCQFSPNVIMLFAHCLRYDHVVYLCLQILLCFLLCLKMCMIMFLSGIFKYNQFICLSPGCFCLVSPNMIMLFALLL